MVLDGGTAIAAHLSHRTSRDLDFFFDDPDIDLASLPEALTALRPTAVTDAAGSKGTGPRASRLVTMAVRSRRDKDQRWRDVLTVGWFAIPLTTALLIGLRQPILTGRYLLVALPGLFLLAGAGLAGIPWRRLRVVAALAVVAITASGLPGARASAH
jgi:hypothetical protein